MFSYSREFSGKHSFTLHPSLDPYRWRNTYTCFVWAGGTFFPFQLCCCVSFWFWQEIGFGCTYYLCTLEYNKVVVSCLVFLVQAGNSFWCFVHMVLIVHYSCVVVSVFGSGGKLVLFLHSYVLRVQYNCGVVLVFWSCWEIVIDFTYVFSVQYSCGVVSVFWLWREMRNNSLAKTYFS